MNTPDALNIQHLKFCYGPFAGRWTLDIAALRLAPAEQLLLTGGSGSGKSTLLHLIAGIDDPHEGVVEVAGRKIHQLHGASRDQFRGRHIGMIFQTFNLLLGFSAIENVMAALMFSSIPPAEHRTRAAALLTKLGIERQNAKPNELSVGQQQRIAVARAVVCDPILVLADEPTASLDPESSGAAMDLIQSLCREKNASLLCVSHDPAMKDRFPKRASLAELRSAQPAAAPVGTGA